MISTSPKKEKEAINSLGADHFVVSKDEAQMSVRPSQPCTLILHHMLSNLQMGYIAMHMGHNFPIPGFRETLEDALANHCPCMP